MTTRFLRILAAACALALAFGLFARRRAARAFGRPGAVGPIRAIALLVPLAAALSAAALEGRPTRPFLVPSGTAFEWLPWSLAAGALVAAAIGDGAGSLGRWACAFAASAVATTLLVPPGMRDGAWQLCAAAACVVAAAGATCGRPGGAARFASWWLVLSVASAMVLLSGFAKLALVIASVAALAASLALIAPFLSTIRAGVATNVAFAIALAATAFVGAGYDETGFPVACWALLAVAPASLAVADVPWVASCPKARLAATLLLPATVACVALAIGLAVTRAPSPAATDADLYGLAASP